MRSINKFILSATLISSVAFAENQPNSLAIQTLTGDPRLACEAILCLSSSTRPSECQPSLNRYFSISAKKWKDTVRNRRNFLKLCPVGNNVDKDKTFTQLRDSILAELDFDCTPENLNKRLEYEYSFNEDNLKRYKSGVRVKTKLPQSCLALMQHGYTDVKLKYSCNTNYHSLYDWHRGYKLQDSKKETIKKDCWGFE